MYVHGVCSTYFVVDIGISRHVIVIAAWTLEPTCETHWLRIETGHLQAKLKSRWEQVLRTLAPAKAATAAEQPIHSRPLHP